ncbi:hypothetical protein ACFSX9_13785 [Flavobacterium ardleyense]|uniref:Uncharacterized protein n=1 Tax=Flavobacterium ardleyense TaxID=2038737 RepID=A0ABW5ZAB0_9FLAO
MAKIKHNNFIDTVDDVLSDAKDAGILHLNAEDKKLTGRTIQIKGKEMYHFGTTGCLCLEQDNSNKEAASQSIKRANELNFPQIDFGVSASFEKRKLGAVIIPKVAYIQARDNYTMEVMYTTQNDYKALL